MGRAYGQAHTCAIRLFRSVDGVKLVIMAGVKAKCNVMLTRSMPPNGERCLTLDLCAGGNSRNLSSTFSTHPPGL